MSDWELIQAYVQRGSEDAFTGLVNRYVDMVYSAALRQVQRSDLAQDVAQAVFLLLATKAREFHAETVLAGWLFRTTRFIASRATRADQRRNRRETESIRMSTTMIPPHTDDAGRAWEQIFPLLDQGISGLSQRDRDAILLIGPNQFDRIRI